MTKRRQPNIGHVEVSYEILERLLKIPADHHIERVFGDHIKDRRVFTVRVVGPRMPTLAEGDAIRVTPYQLSDTAAEPDFSFD